jgi:hypothetical protein
VQRNRLPVEWIANVGFIGKINAGSAQLHVSYPQSGAVGDYPVSAAGGIGADAGIAVEEDIVVGGQWFGENEVGRELGDDGFD